MTKIKRLAPKTCPDCGQSGSLFIDEDRKLTCRLCGYKDHQGDGSPSKATVSEEDRRSQWSVTYGTPNTPDVDRWAEVKYSSGLDYLHQGDYDNALDAFRQAIDQQRDFIDAHIWLARLTLDPEEKRQHYGEVIAQMPMNIEAQRELLVLKGDLSREEADRAADMSREQDVRDAQFAVGTKLVEIVCSNCGGTLEVPSGEHEVTCQFCGHLEEVEQSGDFGMQSLTAAMLKERGQGIKWRVGQHLLHCDNCGAERVITGKKMTQQCPFCGSNHVIKSDALKSFRQPDGIIPFRIRPDAARESLDASLNSFTEKLKGIFVNNRAENVQMTPVYLPFWMFDVTAQVSVTKIDKSGQSNYLSPAPSQTRTDFGDGLNNVPYCGVTSPPHRLTDKLEKYDLDTVKPYDPKLLAGFTAELYSIDYQKASIAVRSEMGERFRFRHNHDPHGDYQTHVGYIIQMMSFRLLMLPVWIATIIEEDGDVRLGLIHGQTGQSLLGKAAKS